MMSEQREYIRIKDQAVIRLSSISELPTDNEEHPLPLPNHFKLLNQIISSQAEEGQLLHAVESDSSATAKYFKIQNSKIQSLAQLIISAHPDATKFPEQKVSISETGVDFYNSIERPVGSLLALNLIFMPDYLSFELYAKVITCVSFSTDNEELGPIYRYGLQFVNIGDQDRDRIARRIFHKQLEERRKQRLGQ
ncbi:PilZ domain-containing protein [Litoribrevibacter albus]|uniref:PilZ domain-containing protein n=1 Tax=Litoribrevibacter albus TaxID=1473156 RepID=A0AA37SBE3_9GAMM|nr:PilZ domain-containing protein [Litoribrevibacter albus]GLQ31609.1 hypothetical protein GCM10007876_20880 [Litoribrevibacter albus]